MVLSFAFGILTFFHSGLMRLQFIVCKVLQNEAYLCAARSKNVVDIVLMQQGLHDVPDKLRAEVTCENMDYGPERANG